MTAWNGVDSVLSNTIGNCPPFASFAVVDVSFGSCQLEGCILPLLFHFSQIASRSRLDDKELCIRGREDSRSTIRYPSARIGLIHKKRARSSRPDVSSFDNSCQNCVSILRLLYDSLTSMRRFRKIWHDTSTRSSTSSCLGSGTVHQTTEIRDVRSRKAMTTVEGLIVLLCSTIER